MDSRKRRRLFRPFLFSLPSSSSTATRFLFLPSSLLLLFLLSYGLQFFPSFRPTRIVPTFLSSSGSNSITRNHTLPAAAGTRSSLPELRIQARIFLPDSLLLLLDKGCRNHSLDLHINQDIDCVYHLPSPNRSFTGDIPAISVDDYDGFQWMVRCPLPPVNYSSAVGLRWRGSNSTAEMAAGEVPAWDRAAYEAVVDGGTAVVFVKGFNLRRDREFDPKQLRCRFELPNPEAEGEGEENPLLTTIAVAAAQEVVRCPLPDTVQMSIKTKQGVKVAIERPRSGQVVPSVARLYENQFENREGHWYQLCGCTMVWNQGSALREWVLYHAWLGVERWFIYDNNSDDGLKSELEKLNSENHNVTRHAWPWIKTQEAGFSHCLLRARTECSWVAFFDVDEFYYFPLSRSHRRISNSQNALKALVAEYSASPETGEIRTKCHSFGPSGLNSHPSQGVTVGYTCRLQRTERHKSIVRPEAVDDTLFNAVHHFKLREGFTSQNVPEGRVVINHYKYQVWDAFKAKFRRRVSTYVTDWQGKQNEGSRDRAPGLGKEAVQPRDWKQWFCEVWDTGLRDFVVANLADRDTGLLPWESSVSL